ncbi:Ion channel [Gloeomargarita lithophora Alchichica-D10]|uniref:Ion channel n=1 Tax=Gloeomargarita lithophora Alchichica-D10 TaxID=1188229 RepID=A0A1J0ADQ2_9CYAN|nr:potassium channel family protein [Gloeomargarita lithophora]APB34066.1 Ion channel [Gloeomargarita lithophora Alchichica-D10]
MPAQDARYIQLLATQIAIFMLHPLVGYTSWGNLVIISLIFWAIMVITRTILPRRTFRAYLVLALFGYAVQILGSLKELTGVQWLPLELTVTLRLLGQIIFVGFLIVPIRSIIQRLFQERRVTVNTLRGSVCVYLLIGTLWSIVYGIIYAVNPDAFAFAHPATGEELYYFSFVTLTTVGYGDIVPVAPLARAMTNVEAIIGQMYIAIILARVVALYRSPEEVPPVVQKHPSQGTIDQI